MSKKKTNNAPVAKQQTIVEKINQPYLKYPDGTDRIVYITRDDEILKVYNGNQRARLENTKNVK